MWEAAGVATGKAAAAIAVAGMEAASKCSKLRQVCPPFFCLAELSGERRRLIDRHPSFRRREPVAHITGLQRP